MLNFILGVMAGGVCGVFTMALCNASKNADSYTIDEWYDTTKYFIQNMCNNITEYKISASSDHDESEYKGFNNGIDTAIDIIKNEWMIDE